MKFLLSLLCLAFVPSYAQRLDSKACSEHKSKRTNLKHYAYKSRQTPSNQDVLNYTLNINLLNNYSPPYPKSFTAECTITTKLLNATKTLKYNAFSYSLEIDSVSYPCSFSHHDDTLYIELPQLSNAGDTVSFVVYYKHKDVDDAAFYCGDGYVFTDSEPERARRWMPCNDRPSDKATFEVLAKVPDFVGFASNGSLIDSLWTSYGMFYHWKSRDPIATYLMVMTSKLNYKLDIVWWHKLSNPQDSIPFYFYYSDGENPTLIEASICELTDYFSTLFGEHPFEKNGFASLNELFPWGGMENQTLTSLCYNCWSQWLIAHEFAHQWFGDYITCERWSDLFLNEAFATYAEALWDEHRFGYVSYKENIGYKAGHYLQYNPGWAIYNPSWENQTPAQDTLFNYAITYAKGAAVLHMLRYVLGDSLFFVALKGYATDLQFSFGNANRNSFAQAFNQYSGQNLDWFFNQWIDQPNHPVYSNSYAVSDLGNGSFSLSFRTKQTQTNTVFFAMPLTLRIVFTDNSDTTLKVWNNSNNQVFDFLFSKQPKLLQFDPNNDIVLKSATTVAVDEMSLPHKSAIRIYPNPVNEFIFIETAKEHQLHLAEIYDLSGNLVYHSPINTEKTILNLSHIRKGCYTLHLKSADNNVFSTTIIKQ